MKKSLRVLLSLAGLATLPLAHAANVDEPGYFGAKVGWSDFYNKEFASGLQDGHNSNNDKVGGGVYGGYQFNDWFALEGGYDYLGKLKVDNASGLEMGKARFQGVQLSGKFSAPLTEALDAYARLGVMGYRVSGDGDHHNGAAPLAALGLDYAIDKNWSTRFEYQYTHHLGKVDKTSIRADNGLLSLGVAYHFGGAPAPVPVAVVTPPPAPAPVQLMEFALKGDTLFAFNKANLNDAGVAELSTIVQQIKQARPQEAAINIAGYTDRIGSDAYNMKLSKERAATVADFLVQQGIPAGIITAEGFGKADPVTGNKCDNVKPRAELIKCLQPDRRVIIRVKGMAVQQ
ncbi:porin OmpA [Craterilacuibacter sinensis]|uniref:Porin OmpA n=1 Tax=Craterilacuibacter sinensis TaxID=2686017 RepID=A0A845BMG1_9NEIS|nr:porin OmpA [Craterilacuibacter sinensis]MXR37535.1 porin OmpA [Craterilacuibacter sinensis]